MNFWTSFRKGSKDFSQVLSAVFNAIVLTIVYFLGIGLVSVIARFSSHRFLDTLKADSYWTDLFLKKQPKEDYLRQF